ncbi:MAG TPA: hypothetical protein DEU95_10230 [Chloroflexi bacterium]|nr:hypothetical protein [Chloroflexota bacterium]
MGEGWVGNGMPADVIVVPDVVAHVPDRAGDGVLGTQQAGISAGPVVVTGDPADITAYSHSGMGEGWLGHGK